LAKLIFTIHDRVNFAIKKGLSGSVSPDKISQEIYAEVMNLWLKYLPEYGKTQNSVLFFKPLEENESVSSLTGGATEGSKAVTYCHKYPVAVVTTTGGKTVTKLTIGEYSDAFNHPNKPPHADYPICKFVGSTIYVAPNVNVTVTYLDKPIRPVYIFTQSGDEYIYDDNASTDTDVDENFHDQIMNRVLANLGISMRDLDLLRHSAEQKAGEGR